MNSALTFKY